MELVKNKRGQFVIIAVLLIAMMIISTAAIMHGVVTYYKHEPWDEYSTLVSNIELSSRHLVELSLANYTRTKDPNVLRNNLLGWQSNLSKIYPGYGIALEHNLSSGPRNVFGTMISFNSGLNYTWEKRKSLSVASVNFTLDVTSIGLKGYKFNAFSLVNMTIINNPVASGGRMLINVTVTDESRNPLIGLKKDNFLPSGFPYSGYAAAAEYHPQYGQIYTIECKGVNSTPTQIILSVWDSRGVQVKAKA